ncbi:MAG TPA: hypothetical protein VFS43_31360 [Polyangiaceae bacterium]|nr:hypothetical protein [Polyangiaceae bacterium]
MPPVGRLPVPASDPTLRPPVPDPYELPEPYVPPVPEPELPPVPEP